MSNIWLISGRTLKLQEAKRGGGQGGGGRERRRRERRRRRRRRMRRTRTKRKRKEGKAQTITKIQSTVKMPLTLERQKKLTFLLDTSKKYINQNHKHGVKSRLLTKTTIKNKIKI